MYALSGTSGAVLGWVNDGGIGLAVNPSGTEGYFLTGAFVLEIDLPGCVATSELRLAPGVAAFGGLAITPDGTALVASTGGGTTSGATIIPLAPPTIAEVSPGSGPASGGTSVTIAGTNLIDADGVSFGTTAASSFTVNGSNSITAVSPAENAGTVDITVTAPAGTSATLLADNFTFGPVPTSSSSTSTTSRSTSSTTTTTAQPTGGGGAFPGGGAPPPVATNTTTTVIAPTATAVSSTATTSTLPTLPFPPGSPAGAYGTPVVGTMSPAGVHLASTSDGAMALLSVPANALPAGTKVGLAVVANPALLKSKIPAGQSYLVSFSVSWATPDGRSPEAATPIGLTITDPSIRAGDVVYGLAPGRLERVGVATVDGQVAVSFRTDADFVLANVPQLLAVDAKAVLRGKAVAVQMTCGPAVGCTGLAELYKKSGHAVLATGRFVVPAGKTKNVVVAETGQGSGFFASRTTSRELKMVVELRGGLSQSYNLTLI
jgi:hypothetical protein